MADPSMLLALPLGAIVGLVLGLTGAGGSIIAVPLLMTGLGWSLTTAAPVALLAVATSAAYGTYTTWKLSYVRYRAALLMATLGILSAPVGIAVTKYLRPDQMTTLFAGVMIIVATRMFAQAIQSPEDTKILRASVRGDGSRARGPLCRLNQETGRIIWTPVCMVLMSGIGAITGFLSGLLGLSARPSSQWCGKPFCFFRSRSLLCLRPKQPCTAVPRLQGSHFSRLHARWAPSNRLWKRRRRSGFRRRIMLSIAALLQNPVSASFTLESAVA